MEQIAKSDILILILGLIFTYFIFEINKDILIQRKEFLIKVKEFNLKRSFFKNTFLSQYFIKKSKTLFRAIIFSYIVLFVMLFILYDRGFDKLFVTLLFIYFVSGFIMFLINNDDLIVYKALIETQNLSEFLRKMNINTETEKFMRISNLYRQASSPHVPCERVKAYLEEIFEELDY